MRMAVTVDDSAVQRRLNRLSARMTDLRPALEEIAEDFHRMEGRLFASHGGSVGQPWPPSPSGQSVTLTGPKATLERSLTVRRARRSVTRITRNSITVGSTDPLAHLHQHGTKPRYVKTYKGKPLTKPRYAGVLPRRVVLAVGPQDEARWRDTVGSYVTSTTEPLGL